MRRGIAEREAAAGPRIPVRFAAAAVLAAALSAACAPFPAHVGRHPRSRAPAASPPPAANRSPECSPSSDQAGSSYVVFGHRYRVLADATGYDDRGIASWYGPNFHGKLTSSGASYDMYGMTAASKVLPLCTWVKVTNLENGENAVVQINDRGPFVANRIIDLSYAAAKRIDMVAKGTALVDVHAIAAPSKRPPPDLEAASKKVAVAKLHHKPALYLQLGAFAEREHAESLRARLVLNQVGSVSIQPATVKGRRLYRVLVGPVYSVTAVDDLTAHLARLGFKGSDVLIR